MTRKPYPGNQRFFLTCDGELHFVGHRPTRVRLKAEDTAALVTFQDTETRNRA